MFASTYKRVEKTKRQLLRILSGIFDPLGFLVPVTFVAKTIVSDREPISDQQAGQ